MNRSSCCSTSSPAFDVIGALDLGSSAAAAAAAAKSLQLCPTLHDPRGGSPIPGILQARTLEWVAISFSNEWKWKVKVKSLSHVWLLVTPLTAAYQAPLSMGFSRQEHWSGLPLPSLWAPLVVSNFLNQHFPSDIWCRISFHILNFHLYIFFGEVSIKVFSPF